MLQPGYEQLRKCPHQVKTGVTGATAAGARRSAIEETTALTRQSRAIQSDTARDQLVADLRCFRETFLRHRFPVPVLSLRRPGAMLKQVVGKFAPLAELARPNRRHLRALCVRDHLQYPGANASAVSQHGRSAQGRKRRCRRVA